MVSTTYPKMNLPIHCAALLLVALVSSEPTSSSSKGNDRHDFFLQSTEADNFHMLKNPFAEHLDTLNLKERDREPLLQDYILDNIEVNTRDDKINNKDFFHDSLFENKDTERVQIFKEYIPNNLIFNDFKLSNTSNEDNILPLFTDDLPVDTKNNDTDKLDTIQVPDNFFPKKKADIQIIKDFASNIKLNEMVQTIKNFFAEKVTDNIHDDNDNGGNFTMNTIKVNDVVQSIKDYFSNKPNNKTKNNKILVPEDFFATKNKTLNNNITKNKTLNNNITNDEPLKKVVKKINENKNKIFNSEAKMVIDTDDYNDTRKVEILKNFLMDEFIANVRNKDLKFFSNTDMFPKTTTYKKPNIEPIKDLPSNIMMNNNDSDQEPTTEHLLPQNQGEYKVHIVKIIFPEKITSKGIEEIDKDLPQFFHKVPKEPEQAGKDKNQDNQYLEKILETQDSIYNQTSKLIENIPSSNNQKITLTKVLKTRHNITAHHNVTKAPVNTEIIEDIETLDRVEIPKNFFPKQYNDSEREDTTVLNLNDFMSKEAFVQITKGNASDIFDKATQLNKDGNYTTHHKTKITKMSDINQDNLFNQMSKLILNNTMENDKDILKFHTQKPHLHLNWNNTLKSKNAQHVTEKNTQTKSDVRRNSPLINKTIFPDVLLKTDIENYKKILVTENLFTDNFVIYNAKHDIINIILPLNSLNFNKIAKSRTNSKNYVIFFVEADIFPNSTKDYKGLYIYHNMEAKLLLANGRDVSAAVEQDSDVYIAANDGIYTYNYFKNTTQQYGTFNKSLIAIAKTRNADIIYGLTDSKVLYNITNNGTQWEIVDNIDKPEAIVLDSANNLYFYSANKTPYIYNGETIIPVENIPAKPKYIQLLRPPLVTESGIPAIIDNKSYIIYSNGRVDIADFEFLIHPTAFSVEAVTMQYFAYNKKLYKFSVKQLYKTVN